MVRKKLQWLGYFIFFSKPAALSQTQRPQDAHNAHNKKNSHMEKLDRALTELWDAQESSPWHP